MKKILIMIIILFSIQITFADDAQREVSDIIEDYLEKIDQGLFTEQDFFDYQSQYKTSVNFRALELFLQARLELFDYAYNDAYKHLEESLILTNDEELIQLKIEVLYYLSEMDMYFFNLSSALDRSFQLRTTAERIGDERGIIEADANIAFGYLYYYDTEQSNKFASEAYNLSLDIQYNPGIVQYNIFQGNIDYYNSNHEGAINKWQRALELYEPSPNYIVELPGNSYKRAIANEMIANGQEEEGLKLLEELLRNTDEKDNYSLYLVYYSLGDYYYYDDLSTSLDYYKKALDKYNAASIIEASYPYEVSILKALGNTHYALGDYKKSADYLYEVLNFEYPETDAQVEKTLSNLDEVKFTEFNSQISLLEALNESNSERVKLSNRLIAVMVVSIVILLVAVTLIIIEIRAKTKTEKELYLISITDSLTKVYNRRKILDLFQSNLNKKNAVLLLDLDNFKEINDQYGHPVGDSVLVKTTQLIQNSIRDTDALGRYGGEEFMVFLENTNKDELSEIAERIRHTIESYQWEYENLKLTASIGITTCFSQDAEEVLQEVDNLMYAAKNSGKNRVVYG